MTKALKKIHTVLFIFYTYLAAPSGGHVFDNKSETQPHPFSPEQRDALCHIFLPKMRKLIETMILTFRMDIEIAMQNFFQGTL